MGRPFRWFFRPAILGLAWRMFSLIAPRIVDRLALANSKHNKTVDSNPANNA